MAKKKFNLTSDIIDASVSRVQGLEVRDSHTEMTTVTLRVPKPFLKEFKSWCAIHDITMSKALESMYAKYKNTNLTNY